MLKYALKIGYRHIDTASFYGNEVGIGNGIKNSGVKREEIFLHLFLNDIVLIILAKNSALLGYKLSTYFVYYILF